MVSLPTAGELWKPNWIWTHFAELWVPRCPVSIVITLQQHNYKGSEWGPLHICPVVFHKQVSTQESYCHETLEFWAHQFWWHNPAVYFQRVWAGVRGSILADSALVLLLRSNLLLILSWFITGKYRWFYGFIYFCIGDSLTGTRENVCSLHLTSEYQTFSMMIEDWKSFINDASPTLIVNDGWERGKKKTKHKN